MAPLVISAWTPEGALPGIQIGPDYDNDFADLFKLPADVEPGAEDGLYGHPLTWIRLVLQPANRAQAPLQSWPPLLFGVTKLKTLEISGHSLRLIPAELSRLVNLESLVLRNNQISSIASEFGALSELHHLDLSGNKLSTLPPEFARLSKLSYLSLNKNLFTTVPECVQKLSSLELLSMANNKFVELSMRLVKRLPPTLRKVSFRDNTRLRWLPPWFRELELTAIDVSGTSVEFVEVLPKSITYLDSHGSALKFLSPDFCCLHLALETVDLDDTPLPSLPPFFCEMNRIKFLRIAGVQIEWKEEHCEYEVTFKKNRTREFLELLRFTDKPHHLLLLAFEHVIQVSTQEAFDLVAAGALPALFRFLRWSHVPRLQLATTVITRLAGLEPAKAELLRCGLVEKTKEIIKGPERSLHVDPDTVAEVRRLLVGALAKICEGSTSFVKHMFLSVFLGNALLKSLESDPDKVIQRTALEASRYVGEAVPHAGHLYVRCGECMSLKTYKGCPPTAPYYILSVGGVSHNSQCATDPLLPSWTGEEWCVAVADPVVQTLVVAIWDYRRFARDRFVASAVVPFARLVTSPGVHEVWVNLFSPRPAPDEVPSSSSLVAPSCTHCRVRNGKLRLLIQFVPLSADHMYELRALRRSTSNSSTPAVISGTDLPWWKPLLEESKSAWVPAAHERPSPVTRTAEHSRHLLEIRDNADFSNAARSLSELPVSLDEEGDGTPNTYTSFAQLPVMQTEPDLFDEMFLALDCSNAVYYDFPEAFAYPNAYESVQWSSRHCLQRFCFVHRKPTVDAPPTVFIPFMGTYNPADVVSDIHFTAQTAKGGAGRVHSGFYRRADSVPILPILELLRPTSCSSTNSTTTRVVLCGHSLGAAVATAMLVRLCLECSLTPGERSRLRVICFGQPMLGEEKLRQWAVQLGVDRNIHVVCNYRDFAAGVLTFMPNTKATRFIRRAQGRAAASRKLSRSFSSPRAAPLSSAPAAAAPLSSTPGAAASPAKPPCPSPSFDDGRTSPLPSGSAPDTPPPRHMRPKSIPSSVSPVAAVRQVAAAAGRIVQGLSDVPPSGRSSPALGVASDSFQSSSGIGNAVLGLMSPSSSVSGSHPPTVHPAGSQAYGENEIMLYDDDDDISEPCSSRGGGLESGAGDPSHDDGWSVTDSVRSRSSSLTSEPPRELSSQTAVTSVPNSIPAMNLPPPPAPNSGGMLPASGSADESAQEADHVTSAVLKYLDRHAAQKFPNYSVVGNYYFISLTGDKLQVSRDKKLILEKLRLAEGISKLSIEQHKLRTYFLNLRRLRGTPPISSSVPELDYEAYVSRIRKIQACPTGLPSPTPSPSSSTQPSSLARTPRISSRRRSTGGSSGGGTGSLGVGPASGAGAGAGGRSGSRHKRLVDVDEDEDFGPIQLSDEYSPLVFEHRVRVSSPAGALEVSLRGRALHAVTKLKFCGCKERFAPSVQVASELRFIVRNQLQGVDPAAASLRVVSAFGETKIVMDLSRHVPSLPPRLLSVREMAQRNLNCAVEAAAEDEYVGTVAPSTLRDAPPGLVILMTQEAMRNVARTVVLALGTKSVARMLLRTYLMSNLFQEQLAEVADLEMRVAHVELDSIELREPELSLNTDGNLLSISLPEARLSVTLCFRVLKFAGYWELQNCGVKMVIDGLEWRGRFKLVQGPAGVSHLEPAEESTVKLRDLSLDFGVHFQEGGIILAHPDNWGLTGKVLSSVSGILRRVLLRLLRSYALHGFFVTLFNTLLLNHEPLRIPYAPHVFSVDYTFSSPPEVLYASVPTSPSPAVHTEEASSPDVPEVTTALNGAHSQTIPGGSPSNIGNGGTEDAVGQDVAAEASTPGVSAPASGSVSGRVLDDGLDSAGQGSDDDAEFGPQLGAEEGRRGRRHSAASTVSSRSTLLQGDASDANGDAHQVEPVLMTSYRAGVTLESHEESLVFAKIPRPHPVDVDALLANFQRRAYLVTVISAYTFNTSLASLYLSGLLDVELQRDSCPEEISEMVQRGLLYEAGLPADTDFTVSIAAEEAPSVSVSRQSSLVHLRCKSHVSIRAHRRSALAKGSSVLAPAPSPSTVASNAPSDGEMATDPPRTMCSTLPSTQQDSESNAVPAAASTATGAPAGASSIRSDETACDAGFAGEEAQGSMDYPLLDLTVPLSASVSLQDLAFTAEGLQTIRGFMVDAEGAGMLNAAVAQMAADASDLLMTVYNKLVLPNYTRLIRSLPDGTRVPITEILKEITPEVTARDDCIVVAVPVPAFRLSASSIEQLQQYILGEITVFQDENGLATVGGSAEWYRASDD
eukprot:Rmarinus@m.28720